MMRTFAAALAFSLAGATLAADEAVWPLAIESHALPFSTGEDPKRTVGKLTHRGTLRLTSDDDDFGGISGLIVSDDGARLLAITDSSHWLTAKLRYRDGRLAGVSGTEIGPLLAPDGRALSGKEGDAEGLTGSLDGDAFVSFERDHRIWRYPFGKMGLEARPSVVPAPAELKRAPDNGGLEGIALLADGSLLALSEAFHDNNGDIRGWLLKQGRDPAQLTLKRRPPFDLTDVRQLENGDVLTLERRFSRAGGVGFEMRRVAADKVVADGMLDGEVVADVGMTFVIDNMEGLAVRKGADGKTFVYLVSDNNFNVPLQQTLLMMFELKD